MGFEESGSFFVVDLVCFGEWRNPWKIRIAFFLDGEKSRQIDFVSIFIKLVNLNFVAITSNGVSNLNAKNRVLEVK